MTSESQESSRSEYCWSAASSSDDIAERVYQAIRASSASEEAQARALPPTIVITGPTGVGKTALSLKIAARIPSEIISADSRQVYRQVDIGSAKVSAEERHTVPHHLVDIVEPTDVYTAAQFKDDAAAVLAGIRDRRRIALVVGGTGHYIQSLIDDLDVPRVEPDWEWRNGLEREAAEHGYERLYERLQSLDPIAAASIPAANLRRVIRALEVIEKTGQLFSATSRLRGTPRPALRLALTMDRNRLYEIVDARVDAMMANGWLDEVRDLLALGLSLKSPPISSSGYRELAAALRGELSLDEAVMRAKFSVHAYVRRQYIWLRRQPNVEWVEVQPGYEAGVLARVTAYLEELAKA